MLTVSASDADPPWPVHWSVNVAAAVSVAIASLPEVAFAPLHPPLAVQAVASVLDHCSVTPDPCGMLDALADKETVGAAGGGGVEVLIVTRAISCADPPGPVQVSVKSLVALRAPLCWLPDVALLPLHAPDAEHEVAFCDVHESCDVPPEATVVGFTLRSTLGPLTRLIVTERCVVPPVPVQDKL